MHFKKDDTLISKGFAIIFLFCYHCFSNEERLAGKDILFSPFSKELGMKISESMNICVPMFAFLSVYGMAILYTRYSQRDVRAGIKFSLRRYVSLIFSFLLPYIFCVTTSLFFNYCTYGEGRIEILGNGLLDFLGLSSLFNTPTMCGTWWYLSLAILMIFTFPIFFSLYKKFDALLIPITTIVMLMSITKITNMNKFLLVIPLAIWCANEDIFYKVREWGKEKKILNIVKRMLILAILFILFYLRQSKWGRAYLPLVINSVIAMITIYVIYDIMENLKIMRSIFAFIGKHSSNMFFVHTFIRWIWFKDFTYSLKYAWVIVIFLMIVTIDISIIIELIKSLLKFREKEEKITSLINKAFPQKLAE